MTSAIRTVENRCETSTVTRPLRTSSCAAAAKRSNSACSVSASRAAVGSSSASSSGSSRMKPRARASFCHWPKDTSTPSSQAGPSWVSRPVGQPVDDVLGAGPRDGRLGGRPVVQPVEVPDPDRLLGTQLEAEEVLEGAGQAVPPQGHGHRREVDAVDLDAPRGRVVEPGEQLDQGGLPGAVVTDDGDDSTGGQVEGDVVEDQAVGPGVAERHVVERDPVLEPVGWRAVAARIDCGGVVLQPHQPAGDVQPDAAQEAELAHGGAHELRELAADHEDEHDLARCPVERACGQDDRADVAETEDRPRQRVPERPSPRWRGRAAPRRSPTRYADEPPARRGCP